VRPSRGGLESENDMIVCRYLIMEAWLRVIVENNQMMTVLNHHTHLKLDP
jgi:hypothetical protein